MNNHKLKAVMGYRLLFAVLLFSSALTIGSTFVQLYLSYRQEILSIEDNFTRIERGQVPGIIASLWVMDRVQLQIQMDGIRQHPHFEWAEIEFGDQLIASSGAPISTRFIQRKIPLHYSYRDKILEIGILRIRADLNQVYQNFLQRLASTLLSQACMILIVSLFVLFIFQFMVTRHLTTMANHFSNYEFGGYDTPLVLSRRSNRGKTSDELDQVVGAINKMGAKLQQDITERKKAEEELRRLHWQNQLILNATGEGIVGLDDQGTITFTNPAARKALGYADGEFTGDGIHWFVHHHKADGIPYPITDCPVHATLTEGASSRVRDEEFWRQDGTSFPASYSITPIIEDGRITGAVVSFRDTTELKLASENRRMLEARLARAEKMEALGTMAGGVAHDLNNVLGIVVGYSEMLLDDLGDSHSARSKAMEILKGGQRAAAITQDLLTLTRRGVQSRQVLNLNRIIMDCQGTPEFTKAVSYHANVSIRTDLETDILNISGSSVHLAKSFINLVSNAAEAMPTGGVINIKTRNQYLDEPISGYDEIKEGDYVVLCVSDSGEGIPAADLKRIFEPFYTKKIMGRSGTGLGLAVVWGTIKDHHGYINVESEEGKGTTFTLYFPVTREECSGEVVAVSASEYEGNGESILVVDDVREQRDLASTMLEKLNYKVSTVPSGEDAVRFIQEHTVDLVVLDMIMGSGMDGLDTYLKLLEIHPHQRAIIVSGFAETERVTKAQELGAGAYVKKPYVSEKLGLAVRKELDRPERFVPGTS